METNQMAITQFTRKPTKNRGNARIWIEGAKLRNANISAGTRFNIEFLESEVRIVWAIDGDRKVSGKDARPIIDINCAGLNRLLFDAELYLVTIRDDSISVQPTTIK